MASGDAKDVCELDIPMHHLLIMEEDQCSKGLIGKILNLAKAHALLHLLKKVSSGHILHDQQWPIIPVPFFDKLYYIYLIPKSATTHLARRYLCTHMGRLADSFEHVDFLSEGILVTELLRGEDLPIGHSQYFVNVTIGTAAESLPAKIKGAART